MTAKTRYDAAMQAAYGVLKGLPGVDTATVVTMSMAIGAAIEAASGWAPEPLADPINAARMPDRWTCGCSSASCAVRWDVFSTSPAGEPSGSIRATCITHGLVATVPSRDGVRFSPTMLKPEAMRLLDILHTEQCR